MASTPGFCRLLPQTGCSTGADELSPHHSLPVLVRTGARAGRGQTWGAGKGRWGRLGACRPGRQPGSGIWMGGYSNYLGGSPETQLLSPLPSSVTLTAFGCHMSVYAPRGGVTGHHREEARCPGAPMRPLTITQALLFFVHPDSLFHSSSGYYFYQIMGRGDNKIILPFFLNGCSLESRL